MPKALTLQRTPKVLVTKIGLDGHDRGSRIVASALRDAGMDVIYTAPWQEIDVVAKVAMEEDVDVIGLSSLATDHLLVPKLMQTIRDEGLDHIKVVVGGIVPDDEEKQLLDAGVAKVFHPGSNLDDIVGVIKNLAAHAQNHSERL
jgi:methylmalonyl-CoA mutase C-terminal domain/subunit